MPTLPTTQPLGLLGLREVGQHDDAVALDRAAVVEHVARVDAARASSSTTSQAGTSVGRLSTTPSAPSASCASTSTTLRAEVRVGEPRLGDQQLAGQVGGCLAHARGRARFVRARATSPTATLGAHASPAAPGGRSWRREKAVARVEAQRRARAGPRARGRAREQAKPHQNSRLRTPNRRPVSAIVGERERRPRRPRRGRRAPAGRAGRERRRTPAAAVRRERMREPIAAPAAACARVITLRGVYRPSAATMRARMFQSLSDKLQATLGDLRSRGALSEAGHRPRDARDPARPARGGRQLPRRQDVRRRRARALRRRGGARRA